MIRSTPQSRGGRSPDQSRPEPAAPDSLEGGFHRIRHCGLLANGSRKASLKLAREFLDATADAAVPAAVGGQGDSMGSGLGLSSEVPFNR